MSGVSLSLSTADFDEMMLALDIGVSYWIRASDLAVVDGCSSELVEMHKGRAKRLRALRNRILKVEQCKERCRRQSVADYLYGSGLNCVEDCERV